MPLEPLAHPAPSTQVFAQRNPRYLLRIVNRHDEFFAIVMLFVERHYLKTWGQSPLRLVG